jgi:hypothetical protein
MEPMQALAHLLGLFTTALSLGALAAAAAKLLWWRELAAVRWLHLAAPAMAVNALVVLAGVLLWGRDGRMATYAALVVACALSLWWQGFGPGRRR